MKIMGIEAIRPRKNVSKRNKNHLIYAYLLRDIKITNGNQVWSSNITYLPLYNDFVYLVAVINWFSRYVLSWELSNRLDVYFCLTALERS